MIYLFIRKIRICTSSNPSSKLLFGLVNPRNSFSLTQFIVFDESVLIGLISRSDKMARIKI